MRFVVSCPLRFPVICQLCFWSGKLFSCGGGRRLTSVLLVSRRELKRLLPRHARRHSLDQTGFIRQQAESPEQLPFKVRH